MKQRRPHQSTSAPAISAFLRRKNVMPISVTSVMRDGKWAVLVSCVSFAQATEAWALLRENGYAMADRSSTWIVIWERAA